MAEMILNSIRLENFKGVKSLELRFAQDRTDIHGANATGKTTLVDAFCWVLWNKDSNDNAPGSDAFHEKPLDNEGHEVHYLETLVELDMSLDGKPFVIKRVQAESWEKKRGFAEEVYKGNVSTYWINGLETKATDFKKRIAEIVPADVFKVIGKLGAFNAMKWQDRRTALVALSGADVDNQLLAQPGYKALAEELKKTGYTVDEFRQCMIDRRRMANDALKMIPVRIDEARRSIVELTAEQIADAKYVVKEAEDDIASVNATINELLNGGERGAKKQRIALLEAQAETLARAMRAEYNRQREELDRTIFSHQRLLERLKAYMGDTAVKAAGITRDLESANAERDELRQAFADAKSMPTEVDGVCPTCGRPLEDEMLEEAKQKAAAARKSAMDAIRAKGKAAAERVDNLIKRSDIASAEAIEAAAKVKEQEEILAQAIAAKAALGTAPDYTTNAELMATNAEIDSLYTDDTADLDKEIAGLRRRIDELKETHARANQKLAEAAAADERKARIAELEAQRRTEGENLAAAEKLLDLVEGFIRDRCASLEESINRRFDNVRWKLFNTQINGGLADCCVCMIPCAAGLVSYECANTAAQVNADIEIVRNLSQYYGVKLPLFVDNAERINTVADAGTQMITLSVSNDKTLKVEE